MKKMFLAFICIEIIFFPKSFAQRQPNTEILKQRDKYIFSVKHEKQKFTESVPFESALAMNQIIIPVTINGKIYHFLFDTGAITLISEDLKEELGLTKSIAIQANDASNITNEVAVYKLDSLNIGNVSFYNIGTVSQNLSEASIFACTKIDGIIGTNIMKTCYWKVDYKNHLLLLSDGRIKSSKPALILNFDEGFSGVPHIKATLGKYNFTMIWDSGSSEYLSFADSLYFNSGKAENVVKGTGSNTLTIFNKKNAITEYKTKIDSFYIQGHLFVNQVASVNNKTEMGTVGNEFMKQFETMTLDWKRHKIYLQSKPSSPDSSVVSTFGVIPDVKSGICYVSFLWDNSPAKKEGIRLGDTIVSINGKSVTNISNEAWCSLRSTLTEQKALQLKISRSGEIKRYDIKKYDFFKK